MRNNTTRVSRCVASATAFGLLAFANMATASDQAKTTPVQADAPTSASSSSALRKYIDPKTGKSRAPTAEEIAEAAAQDALAEKGKPKTIKMVRQPNGMLRATDRDGLLMESVVAHVNADGTLSYQFVQGVDPNAKPVQAPTQPEEK